MAEHQKILTCGPELRVAFQGHLVSLCDLLLAKYLITSDNASELKNPAQPEPQRASRMVEFVRNKVKISKDNYYVFVKALQTDHQYRDILKILGEAPKTATNRQQNDHVKNGSSLATPNTASAVTFGGHVKNGSSLATPNTASAVTYGERPRFTNTDMTEVLQSNEPKNEPRHLRADIEIYLSKVLVLLHTVKQEELVAVYKYLKPPIHGFMYTFKCHVTSEASLILGKFGNHDAAVVQTEKSIDCADGIRKALKSLPNVQLVIGVGFAYGNKEKCKLGDVLVSKYIYDVTSTRLENEHIKLEGGRMSINMKRVIDIFAKGALKHRFVSVTADPHARESKILADTIISGANLVNNERYVREILKHDARSIGGEMEGNTVAKCVLSFCEENQGRKIDFIIIKGVADYGDGTKGKPWQFTASLSAADYADDRLEKEGGNVYFLPIGVHVPAKKQKMNDTNSTKVEVKYAESTIGKGSQDALKSALTRTKFYHEYCDKGENVTEKDSAYHKSSSEIKCDGVMVYKHDELKESTGNFDNLIGEGGYGKVYRGTVRGTSVAVKVLSERGTSFMNEINTLKRYCHVNILRLMGYCEDPPMLILPYMAKGSLHKLLHSEPKVAILWDVRISILTDTARGLTYLHKSEPPLVHHDINTSNILISERGEAKICDFGFSITLPERKGNKTLVTAAKNFPLSATVGYLPPEYYRGKYSTFSDVYSYGIVVLETYTRELAYSEERDDERIVELFDKERRNLDSFTDIADTNDGVLPNSETIATVFSVMEGCLENSYKKRPSIENVLNQWEEFAKSKNPQ